MIQTDVKEAIRQGRALLKAYTFSPLYTESTVEQTKQFLAQLNMFGLVPDESDMDHMLESQSYVEANAQSKGLIEFLRDMLGDDAFEADFTVDGIPTS